MDLKEHIELLINQLSGVYYDDGGADKFYQVVEILRETKKNDNTVYTFGNGGSHSTASHFACDLLKACGIKAVCVSDMIPSTYAYMNDDGIETMFDAVLCSLCNPGDVIVAFSCSGNSKNVVEALWTSSYNKTILFTGDDGGAAAERADLTIKVYNKNIRIQESAHLAYCHAIVEELLNEAV